MLLLSSLIWNVYVNNPTTNQQPSPFQDLHSGLPGRGGCGDLGDARLDLVFHKTPKLQVPAILENIPCTSPTTKIDIAEIAFKQLQ